MFCTVKGQESLGTAKVIDATGSNWEIEYFDGPTKDGRTRQKISKSLIMRRVLEANTRIYVNDETTGRWSVGRVIQDDEDGAEIRFVNKRDVFHKHDEIYVRWRKPIADPIAYLSNAIAETPRYAESRRQFLDSYIKQRGTTGGISSLLSSGIELNSHQIDVIRRVLSDPSQRYILADEVGLGKTIEAGVIIRQAVLDDPKGHNVLVLVPPSLLGQWRNELIVRFGLEAYIDISVNVLPQEMSPAVRRALVDANMIVIDEAHHLASLGQKSGPTLYDWVSDSAIRVERILLLSATPALRNEVGFLRMLHLIDPVVYRLDDLSTFQKRINHRQILAESVAMLDPQNTLQLDPVLEDLLSILTDDERLKSLVHELKNLLVGIPDESDPRLCEAIRAVRAHISETYRLHRRILRNRRKSVSWLTPNRKSAICKKVSGIGRNRLESALENWRISAVASLKGNGDPSQELVSFYWSALKSLMENIEAFEDLCNKRLVRLKNPNLSKTNSFEEEVVLLKECLDSTIEWGDRFKKKLEFVESELRALLDKKLKIVVFCSEKNVADKVFDYLSSTGLRNLIVRHEVSEYDEYENQEAKWLSFQNNTQTQIIVCDERAEEGLNLQGGRKALLHFDLPLNPNRVEQRIGRLDRYGTGIPVESLVIIDEDSTLEKAWYEVLDLGLGVFKRSISSLQYLIEDQLGQLRSRLILDGSDSFFNLKNILGGEDGLVSREFRLIDQQDALDELAPQLESDLDEVAEVDSEWKVLKEASQKWIVGTLMFEFMPLKRSGQDNLLDPPFRFRYRVPGGGGFATLLPLSGFLENFLGALDFDAPGSNSRQPLSFAHSYHRKSAINANCRPLRYGSEFIEAIKAFSDLDDRGRSYGIWRLIREKLPEESGRLYFRFSYVIEVDQESTRAVITSYSGRGQNLSLNSISRRGDALLPPFVVHVWVDEDGVEVGQEIIRTYLELPYNNEGPYKNYIDTNLRSERLLYLIENHSNIFGNWAELCLRMKKNSLDILQQREEFRDRIKKAQERAKFNDEIRFAQLSTRIQHLKGREASEEVAQLKFEKSMGAAITEGITEPVIRLDVAGFVFLSNEPISFSTSS